MLSSQQTIIVVVGSELTLIKFLSDVLNIFDAFNVNTIKYF